MGLTTTTSSAARRRIGALSPAAPAPTVTPTHELLLRRLGVPTDPSARLRLAVSGAFGVLVLLVVGGPTVTTLAGAAAGLAFAGWRRGARARHVLADERELPLLLERVARHLRAGGSLSQAFVAATPPPPPSDGRGAGGLAQAWRAVADRSSSVGMVPALDEWADQARGASTPSVALAVAALAVAAATGGSPARAVDGVASTLRSRLAVAEEVRALSSQARASAMVIAVSPVGFGVLAAATDDRTAAFLATPAGVALAATGLALDAAGAWWMARLCRVRA